jgi:hypothetical protein
VARLDEIRAVLVASANVSKLLWPIKDRRYRSHFPERGEQLREALGVDDDPPYRLRTFRDHYEHFDERIERWAHESEHHNLADSCIISKGAISGLDEGDFLRVLDPGSLVLTFRGETYDLPEVAKALGQLHDAAEVRVEAHMQALFLGAATPSSPAP